MTTGPPARPALAAAIAAWGTQADLAASVGVHPNTISAIVRGINRPSVQLKRKIARCLNVDDVDGLFALHPDIMRLVDSAVDQGFPRHIEDPTVLRTLVTLLRTGSAVSGVQKAKPRTSATDAAPAEIKWKTPPPARHSKGAVAS